jgi:hydroxyacylglutathione hydrolase
VGASLERLVAFAATHSVPWVLGNHIEVSRQPHEPSVYRTVPHADERVLPFAPSKLLEIAAAVRAMGDAPKCEIYEDFVIHPTYLCAGDWNG